MSYFNEPHCTKCSAPAHNSDTTCPGATPNNTLGTCQRIDDVLVRTIRGVHYKREEWSSPLRKPVFYFVAQTGVIHETLPETPSNFYRYSFPVSFRGHLEALLDITLEDEHGFKWDAKTLKLFASKDTGEGDN